MATREPQRKRMRRREGLDARFLTFSCYNRLPLLGNARIRDQFVEAIVAARRDQPFQLIAWVVMPEHVHMMILPSPGHPVSRVMSALKRPFAEVVVGRWRELKAGVLHRITGEGGRARFWQPGGGFDRNVRDEAELFREIAYIHENPVERGLAKKATDWAWSSARWYAGRRDGTVGVDRPWGMTQDRLLEGERCMAERGGALK